LTTIALLASLTLIALLPGCDSRKAAAESADEMKVLVLGMDGLDPILLEELMAEDRLPNFARLRAIGDYSSFGTSMPPQSPVAWSNFISGSRPGTHQIYDFIHRDPSPKEEFMAVKPFLSTTMVVAPSNPDRALTFGRWRIPLEGGGIENLRQGDAFWNHLVKHGITTTIYRMPANYPPPSEAPGPGEFHVLSGMGTPDLLGTYGEFTCLKEDMRREHRRVAGGDYHKVTFEQQRAVVHLDGPPNFLLDTEPGKTPPSMKAEVEIVREPIEDLVTITIGDEKLVLREGEWTDWIPVTFETGLPASGVVGAAGMPTSMAAIVRMYVKQVHPKLNIYVTPLNIDPANPVNPISYPTDWAAEVAATTGAGGMYTTGIPEDTKALRSGALNEDEFLQMVHLLVDERTKQYHDALANFKRGFLYYYFGHTDQLAHIFWRDMDPAHPGRLPEQDGMYDDIIFKTYEEMDVRLAEAFEVMDDDDVLIVMSDHGFCSFRRGLNVNNWLVENGFQTVRDKGKQGRRDQLFNIRFDQTRVYALGLNCLYVNLKDREKHGIVSKDEYRRVMEEVISKLEQVRDTDGSKMVEKVYITIDEYPEADMSVAPDMLVGYTRNYRASWATALGGIGKGLYEDNKDRWSGDHCIAQPLVPGIILSNMKLKLDDPELSDLGPAILNLYGIETPEHMLGRNIFGEKVPLRGR